MIVPPVFVVDQQDRLRVCSESVASLVRFVLDAERCVSGIEIAFVDDETQSEIHQRFMGIPGPTDVITFPSGESRDDDVLGEVVVSTDTAVRQATEHPEPPIESDPEREVLLYVVHGVLHLLGYDDRDLEEADIMKRRQNELFAAWWSRRPERP